MPEGDTIAKLARALAPLLEGRRLRRAYLRTLAAPELEGRRVDSVEARGKHLLVGLAARRYGEPRLLLRTHLGLHGSWHQYPRDAAWRKPSWQAAVVLETEDRTFVCFNAKDVECLLESRVGLSRALRRLGPDLLANEVNEEEILRRLARRPGSEDIASVLLDQTVACGIGNVFKSEVLFLAGELPRKPLRDLDEPRRLRVYRIARALLAANTERGLRTTTGARRGDLREPRLWVYGRSGLSCLRCGAPVRFARLGGKRRSTYWCDRCQS